MEKNQQDVVQKIMELAGSQGLSNDQLNQLMSQLAVGKASAKGSNPEEEKSSVKQEDQI